MPAAPLSAPSLQPVLRLPALRDLEARAHSEPLMERAGRGAADVARSMLGSRDARVLVMAGPGNNGGDGFVLARHLRHWFFDVTVVFAASADALPGDAAAAYRSYIAAGGTTCPDLPESWRGGLIVDALFGIGLTRAVGAPYARWIEWANQSGMPILALDIPSGLRADTGMTAGPCVQARATATFIALKPGLLTGDGPDRCGALHLLTLGLADAAAVTADGHRLDWPALASALPEVFGRRQRNVHKGTFGTLGIIGGAAGMTGAPLLAGRAALRAGAGRVRLGFAATRHPAVDFGSPELMLGTAAAVLGSRPDALVVGPGLGRSTQAAAHLLHALRLDVPVVLDADALNLVAADAALREALRSHRNPVLLTPHPTEAARLAGCSTAEIQADRLAACLALAREFRAHVVLKGAGSILATPEGAWDVNASGNPGLSAAGSGDVLAGFAGAMLAQGIDPRSALRYAVCLHGAAADRLVAEGTGPVGLGASELADAARRLINEAARLRE